MTTCMCIDMYTKMMCTFYIYPYAVTLIFGPHFLLPALLQKLVGEFFGFFGREIWREIWWEFCGIFRTHNMKAQESRGQFQSIFCEKIRASKTIFRANFVLQTCRPDIFSVSEAAIWTPAIFLEDDLLKNTGPTRGFSVPKLWALFVFQS